MWTLVALLVVWLVASPVLAVVVGRSMAAAEAVRVAPGRRSPRLRVGA